MKIVQMKYLIGVLTLGITWLNYSHIVERKSSVNADHVTQKNEIPEIKTDISEVVYDPKSSLWNCSNEIYSGYIESYYPHGSIKQRFGVLDGLKHGTSKDWYEDGHIKFTATFNRGKLHGEKNSWFANATHQQSTQLQYKRGKLHGEQIMWYDTGEMYKRLNLNMGKEEGIQQAFRKNGAVYANYEAREGRIFGLKKASLCFELENENLVYGK